MVAFAQRCEVIDGMNAATILGEDKVESGWQLTCPVEWVTLMLGTGTPRRQQ